jgi:carboxylesterase
MTEENTGHPKIDNSRFNLGEGSTGILLLHGYTSSPAVVRPMGEYLAGQGMRVVAPLLPGHGTSPEDLNKRTWRELADAAADELYALQAQCDRVFVGGLSMGGLLSLHLGQRCTGIHGLIPMAAALYAKSAMRYLLPIVRRIISTLPKSKDPSISIEDLSCAPLLWTYDDQALHFVAQLFELMEEVRRDIHKLDQPLLIFQGEHDKTVPMKAAWEIAEKSSSHDTELVVLPHSGHCLTIDGERQQVFEKSWQWIQRLS